MPTPFVPEDVLLLIQEEISRPDYYEIYRRFLEGEDLLGFDTYDLDRNHFEAFVGPAPYPVTPDMLRDKEVLAAAIHGYMVCKYLEELDTDTYMCRRKPPGEVLACCRARHKSIVGHLASLQENDKNDEPTTWVGQLTAMIQRVNCHWTAQRLVYIVEDLRVVREQGITGLVLQYNERKWILKRRREYVDRYTEP